MYNYCYQAIDKVKLYIMFRENYFNRFVDQIMTSVIGLCIYLMIHLIQILILIQKQLMIMFLIVLYFRYF